MKWRVLALLPLLVAVCWSPALAAEKSARQELIKKEKSLEDVKRQIRENKKGIIEAAEKEMDILGELEVISKDLAAKREELRAVRASIQKIRKESGRVGAEIERLEARKRELADRLKARLKAMYKMKRGETMEVLFSSDAGNLGRRHKYLTMLMDMDAELMEDFSATLGTLEAEKEKNALLLTELGTARAEALLRQKEAEALQRKKLALLSGVKQEKARRERVQKELEEAATELSKLIDRLRAAESEAPPSGTGFPSMKGRLPMPVNGKVISFYGKVRHPKFQTVTFNNGITIESPLGQPVNSVYAGKVIYVGWLKGYGQVMIIDHKGGFYTLYAHLGKVLKETGEEVESGAEVGLIGDSGPDGRPGLYFEIRQKGIPRDPMAWLSAR
ncbi:MAG: peptidoglycan DD-metalloendopeptidase family protein [Deltaproteobacteria bacterium]|nr:peptidoglycan DD-metalloendopeptidase family protein [Deltaproteobacteria bacterium]MBZ0219767.1 peptidoglycan DD-metalloendopeptidase family protein [Deltaproteobacteria bacterium]